MISADDVRETRQIFDRLVERRALDRLDEPGHARDMRRLANLWAVDLDPSDYDGSVTEARVREVAVDVLGWSIDAGDDWADLELRP